MEVIDPRVPRLQSIQAIPSSDPKKKAESTELGNDRNIIGHRFPLAGYSDADRKEGISIILSAYTSLIQGNLALALHTPLSESPVPHTIEEHLLGTQQGVLKKRGTDLQYVKAYDTTLALLVDEFFDPNSRLNQKSKDAPEAKTFLENINRADSFEIDKYGDLLLYDDQDHLIDGQPTGEIWERLLEKQGFIKNERVGGDKKKNIDYSGNLEYKTAKFFQDLHPLDATGDFFMGIHHQLTELDQAIRDPRKGVSETTQNRGDTASVLLTTATAPAVITAMPKGSVGTALKGAMKVAIPLALPPTSTIARRTDDSTHYRENEIEQGGILGGFVAGMNLVPPSYPRTKLIAGITGALGGEYLTKEVIEKMDLKVNRWRMNGGAYTTEKSLTEHIVGEVVPLPIAEGVEHVVKPLLNKLTAPGEGNSDPQSLYSRLNRYMLNKLSTYYAPNPTGPVMESVFTETERKQIQAENNHIENIPGYHSDINPGLNPWEWTREVLGREVGGWDEQFGAYQLQTAARIIDLIGRFQAREYPFSDPQRQDRSSLDAYLRPIITGDTEIQTTPRIFSGVTDRLRELTNTVITSEKPDFSRLKTEIYSALEPMHLTPTNLSTLREQYLHDYEAEIQAQFVQLGTRWSGADQAKGEWVRSQIFQRMKGGDTIIFDQKKESEQGFVASRVSAKMFESMRTLKDQNPEEQKKIQEQKWYDELLSDTTPLSDQGGMQTNRYFALLLDNAVSYLQAKSFFEQVEKGNMRGYTSVLDIAQKTGENMFGKVKK